MEYYTRREKKIKCGRDFKMGFNSLIEDEVIIGDNVVIGNYCIVKKNTIIGNNVKIGDLCVIGSEPNIEEDDNLSKGYLYIDDGARIRDNVVICKGYKADSRTQIGEKCNIAYGAYIAHNCMLGSKVIVAPHVCLGGNVIVGHASNIGTNAFIHQGLMIGEFCMIGAQSKVVRDVPHYALVDGIPAFIKKVNKIGMERNGFTSNEINEIQYFYDDIYMDYLLKNNNEDMKKGLLSENWFKIIMFIDKSLKGCTRTKVV